MGNMSSIGLWIQIVDLVAFSPWLVVMFAGGLGCLRRLQDRPREGWLVGGAIILALFARFGVGRLVSLASMYGFMSNGSGLDMRLIFLVASDLPNALVNATAWGLILYAAFGEGTGPRTKYLIEDDREAT